MYRCSEFICVGLLRSNNDYGHLWFPGAVGEGLERILVAFIFKGVTLLNILRILFSIITFTLAGYSLFTGDFRFLHICFYLQA